MSLRSNVFGLCAVLFVSLAAEPLHAATLARWVQFGASGDVLLRVVTDHPGDACPLAAVDGAAVTLELRGDPANADPAFPVTMCEASVPLGGRIATIDGVNLKLPVAEPQRIVVLGDTGCRLAGKAVQNCDDPTPSGFPFAAVAQFIATFSPDMIVHVGDYYYREDCTRPSCANSPTGDNWASWNADFFTPARAMLGAAPLALSRGNHETCGRGARGWYTLLDPRPYDRAAVACALGSPYDYPASYVVPAGAVSLIMFDSSYANSGAAGSLTQSSFEGVETVAATYQADIARTLAMLGGKPAVLVTHKPAFGMVRIKGSGPTARITAGGNPDEQSMFADGVPEAIRFMLAGHIHNFQTVQFEDAQHYAPQLVVGMGGTMLDKQLTPPRTQGVAYQLVDGTAAVTAETTDIAEYGFAVLDRTPGGYTANLYYLNGVPQGHCVIQIDGARSITCTN